MLWRALIVACFLFAVPGRGFEYEEYYDHDLKEGQIWAVLVAGSKGWKNYRHQSNICHVYHLLTKKHGIPKQNVITFMYDDIAFNEENPNPGVIINAIHGRDVYKGVVIDYKGRDVNPETFLDVLGGKSIEVGSRRTLESGPNDIVFVNFVDHGGPGFLSFPDDHLHLTDLTQVLERMYIGRRYRQMLWYVEACHSGSMFSNLSPYKKIVAHTAAQPDENSHACVYDHDLNVYLSDCWSYNWMKNTEQIFPNLEQVTVGKQYEIVKKMTTQSHASIYGDLTYIYNEQISTFLGHPGEESGTYQKRHIKHLSGHYQEPVWKAHWAYLPTATPDVMMDHLVRKRARSTNLVDAVRLTNEIEHHIRTEQKVQKILEKIALQVTRSKAKVRKFHRHHQTIEDPECHKDVLNAFFEWCYKMQTHPYITKYLHRLTNLCNAYNVVEIRFAVAFNCEEQNF